jgi:TRAP-type mannitol/chloroaromatic compound transport system permease small subunit
MDADTRRSEGIVRIIDRINEIVGKVICFTFVAIMLIQVMEVILRYIFNSPTIWAWDVNSQLFTATALLGGGHVLLHDGHVRMDLIYSRVGTKAKLIFDLIGYSLILLAFMVIIWKAGDMAWYTFQTKARGQSYFAPLLWPVKSTLFFGAILLFVQAAATLSRTIVSFKQEKSTRRLICKGGDS